MKQVLTEEQRLGYNFRGKPVITHKLLLRGQHISVITAMSATGMLVCMIVHKSVTGDTFYDFVLSNWSSTTLDCCNPHTVVILDNTSIHHTGPAVIAIKETGGLVQFLLT